MDALGTDVHFMRFGTAEFPAADAALAARRHRVMFNRRLLRCARFGRRRLRRRGFCRQITR
jgi:hypothetical protein